MIVLIIFWALFGIYLILALVSKRYKTLSNFMPAVLLLAASFLIVAIVTKDPLFSAFGVPVEFEWVVGLFITGLSSWKLYFSPLKERIIKTESEVSSIKTSVSSIKEDTRIIKEKLMK